MMTLVVITSIILIASIIVLSRNRNQKSFNISLSTTTISSIILIVVSFHLVVEDTACPENIMSKYEEIVKSDKYNGLVSQHIADNLITTKECFELINLDNNKSATIEKIRKLVS